MRDHRLIRENYDCPIQENFRIHTDVNFTLLENGRFTPICDQTEETCQPKRTTENGNWRISGNRNDTSF